MLRNLLGPSPHLFEDRVQCDPADAATLLRADVWITDNALEQLAKGQGRRLGDVPWDRRWLPFLRSLIASRQWP